MPWLIVQNVGMRFLLNQQKSTSPHEPLSAFLVGPFEGPGEEYPECCCIDGCVEEQFHEEPEAPWLTHGDPIDQVRYDKVAGLH